MGGGVLLTAIKKKALLNARQLNTTKLALVKRHTELLLLVRSEAGDKELPLGTGKTGEGLLDECALLPDLNIGTGNFVSVKLHLSPDVRQLVMNLSSPADKVGTIEVDGGEKKFNKH